MIRRVRTHRRETEMSVRKRTWMSRHGEQTAWIVDYADQHGKRRLRTFKRKGEADKFAANTPCRNRRGHPRRRQCPHHGEARPGKLWLESWAARTTSKSARSISTSSTSDFTWSPFIGREKLSKLTVPFLRAFQDKLHNDGRSAPMIKGVIRSLGGILADAQERGLIVRNAVRELNGRRRRGLATTRKPKVESRRRHPAADEMSTLLAAAEGKWKILFMIAVFTWLARFRTQGFAVG